MNKQRILIVDGETGSRRGLSELVASWGYETEAAADGAEWCRGDFGNELLLE